VGEGERNQVQRLIEQMSGIGSEGKVRMDQKWIRSERHE